MGQRSRSGLVPGTFGGRLALITAIGGLWRLIYLFTTEIHQPLLLNDSIYYSIQAGLNSEGQWFEDGLSGLPGAEHGPLTSLYLTPWSLGSGDGVAMQRFAITLLGIATVAVLGFTGRRLATLVPQVSAGAAERVGLVAAAIAAVYPNLWINDSVVMSETPALLLVSLALLVALRHHAQPTWRNGAGLGALVGLATLARSEVALLAVGFVVLSVLLVRRRHASWLAPVAIAVASFVTVLPWTAWNLMRFNEPVLLTTNDGNTWLGANCPTTYYVDVGGWDIRCLGDLHDVEGEDASNRSIARRDEALDYIGDHRGRVPVVVLARLGRAMDVYGLTSLVHMDVGEDKAAWAAWAGIVCFWLLVPAAVIGWLVARRRRASARWWILVPVIAVVVTTVLFYGAHRIRAPAEPSLVLLAALAILFFSPGSDRTGRRARKERASARLDP